MSNTVYAYDNVGNLTGVTYAGVPSFTNHPLSFSYDNLNELTSMSDAIGTTSFTYTPGGQLASENGPWADDRVAYTYANRLRTWLDLQQPNAPDWVQSYGYDAAARMTGITSPAGTFGYTYNRGLGGTASASALVADIALPNGAAITNAFDGNARMTVTSLVNSGGTNLDLYAYTYNVGNQRTAVQRSGENTADYTYDAIGQVIADQAYEVSGGAARLNEQLHYGFDRAGNLNYRTNNALIENFQVNSLNELTANTNGGTLTVMGTTTSPATNVAVNGANAARYNDATFAATNMPLTTAYTATASDSLGRSASNTVTVSIATNTTCQYDGNGNLTNDGLRSFAYDDENQLVQVWMTTNWFSQFTYDGKMRRRIRQEYAWQNGAWVQTNEVCYVYDGNEVIQERDINNLLTTTYTRGKDLSGSLEGAGGIGGLLARTDNSPLATGHSFFHSDANGNVTMLIHSSNAMVAKYLYDAFGNIISKSGLMADANLNRFSSKEAHTQSGLVYYLYRYYDPNLQRWPNRDPISELGHRNVRGDCLDCFQSLVTEVAMYRFCGNAPDIEYDSFGLNTTAGCEAAYDFAIKKIDQDLKKCIGKGTTGTLVGLGVTVLATGVVGIATGGVGLAAGGTFILGAGGTGVADLCHISHCGDEANQKKKNALGALNSCLQRVSD
jgi:RHS repeat-associated protein